MKEPTCAKCQGEMKEGFVLDWGHGAAIASQWAPGEPRYSLWFGVHVEERLKIKSFRCNSCGYLENYALERI